MSTLPLPVIASLREATDFSHTVSPYLHQLSLSHVLPLLTRSVSLSEWYISTNPLITAILFALALSGFFAVLQLATKNSSHVDRAWSILPPLYIAHFAFYAHYALENADPQRLDTAVTFAVLWGLRLTYNFYRRGGYQWGHEDYRHAIVEQKLFPQPYYTIYSLLFLALGQNLILAALSFPAYILLLVSYQPTPHPFSTLDTFCTQGLIILILLEGLADQQQWDFHTAKAFYKKTGKVPKGFEKEDLERGFVVTGLWSWSRHPNFVCEQAIWVLFYQWTCWHTDVLWNWAGAGVLGLMAVFRGSVWLTEDITRGKYKEYKEYQARVPRFVPGLKGMKTVDKRD